MLPVLAVCTAGASVTCNLVWDLLFIVSRMCTMLVHAEHMYHLGAALKQKTGDGNKNHPLVPEKEGT